MDPDTIRSLGSRFRMDLLLYCEGGSMIPVDLSASCGVGSMIRTDPGSRSWDQIPGSVFGIHGHVWKYASRYRQNFVRQINADYLNSLKAQVNSIAPQRITSTANMLRKCARICVVHPTLITS